MSPPLRRGVLLLLLLQCGSAHLETDEDALLQLPPEVASLSQLSHIAPAPPTGKVAEPLVVDISDWQHIKYSLPKALHNVTSSHVIVTATNRADKAIANLKNTMGAQLIVLQTGPEWPGNLMKLAGFIAAAAALPAETVVLFTDCCDVWFRPGDGTMNVFSRFLELVSPDVAGPLAGKEVVIAAERGYLMIGHAGNVTKLDRPHVHAPEEFPSNPYETELGIPDTCSPPNSAWPRCVQSKLFNAGLVIGNAGYLHNFYGNVWKLCDRCQQWDDSKGSSPLGDASEQNQIAHYLLTEPKFDGGLVAIDYEMSLFHVTPGFAAEDYEEDGGLILLTLPGGRQVELQAPVIHIPGNDEGPAIVNKLRGPNSAYWHAF